MVVKLDSPHLLCLLQSIIEEEGGTLPTSNNGGDDSSNWDKPLIVAEPDVMITNISDRDQFLLLACDGLYDVFTPEEVVVFVRDNMEKHGDTQRCCQVTSVYLFCLLNVVVNSLNVL